MQSGAEAYRSFATVHAQPPQRALMPLLPGDPPFIHTRLERDLQEWAAKVLRNRNVLFQASTAGATYDTDNRYAQANAFRARGVSPGFPDLYILEPGNRGEPALFIELKAVGVNTMRPEQIEWQQKLRRMGFVAVMCNSCPGFLALLDNYFHGTGLPFVRHIPSVTIKSLGADLESTDDLTRMIAGARLRALNDIQTRAAVREEMAARMDTGVRVNATLQVQWDVQPPMPAALPQAVAPPPPPAALGASHDHPVVID